MRLSPVIALALAAILFAGCSQGKNNSIPPPSSPAAAAVGAAVSPSSGGGPATARTAAPSSQGTPAAGGLSTAPGASPSAGGQRAGASPTPSAPDRENDLAARMLLDLSDFPSGWTHDPPDTSPSPLDACEMPPKEQTGKAQSGLFAPPSITSSESVEESLIVTASPADAKAAIASRPAQFACYAKVMNDGGLDDENTQFTGAVVSPQTFPAAGDSTQGFRIQAHITGRGAQAGISEDVYLDYYFVQRGRIAFAVDATNVRNPVPAAELQGYVTKALAHVDQVQGGR